VLGLGMHRVEDIQVRLALAKLQFKVQDDDPSNDSKAKSLEMCTAIQTFIRNHLESNNTNAKNNNNNNHSTKICTAKAENDNDLPAPCSLEDAADAFHLAGWVCIHVDDDSDISLISFTVALNQRGHDFEGGGTWFECK
jgi:hypothetical protein